ncbi:hypothetical protein BMS3Abin17_00814 [archaeon BMS3Abin17]|nr:hypothetical protein BMS3Abin17_00814 [archaeon BMS3Abin17]HDZ60092.1 hypothetical protein [Candidatus Pacearchaeota archaeon]
MKFIDRIVNNMRNILGKDKPEIIIKTKEVKYSGRAESLLKAAYQGTAKASAIIALNNGYLQQPRSNNYKLKIIKI